jgi:uncharacterized protein
MATDAHKLLEQLAKGLVADPDVVNIKESEEDGQVRFDLEVAPDDIGKVIGRQGRTAKALRAVIGASLARDGRRGQVEIVD